MKQDYPYPELGIWLETVMKAFGISQNEMSRMAHMSKKSLEGIFKGKTRD